MDAGARAPLFCGPRRRPSTAGVLFANGGHISVRIAPSKGPATLRPPASRPPNRKSSLPPTPGHRRSRRFLGSNPAALVSHPDRFSATCTRTAPPPRAPLCVPAARQVAASAGRPEISPLVEESAEDPGELPELDVLEPQLPRRARPRLRPAPRPVFAGPAGGRFVLLERRVAAQRVVERVIAAAAPSASPRDAAARNSPKNASSARCSARSVPAEPSSAFAARHSPSYFE